MCYLKVCTALSGKVNIMSKIRKNKWIKISTALSTLFSTSQVKAIDLQSKTKNVDKSDFNTISSPFKKPFGSYSIIGEISDTKQPLILKQSNGTNQTLIEGLQAFELSFLYEMTDSIQLGILVPGEKPYGLIGPYNEAKSYLGNILIEPKVYISNNIALIPIYYVPSNNQADLQISGSKETIDLGLKSGAYGVKLAGGQKTDNGITTAYQIGAIIAPESKFRDIDQSMKLQFGAGISKEISGGLKLLAEAYGEKYKSNMPLEALAMIEYSNKNFMVRFGGGSGDIQGSGSNTTRLLANFAYYFGTESKSETKFELSNKPLSEDDYKKFKKKVEKVEDQIRQEESPLDMKEEGSPTEIQNTPESGSFIHSPLLPIASVKIKKNDPLKKLPFDQAQKIFLDTIDKIRDEDDLAFLKDISHEDFKRLFFQKMDGQDFRSTITRTVASVSSGNSEELSLLAKIEKAHVTQTAIFEIQSKNYHWSEPKAKYVVMNLRRVNASIKENLNLYKIYKNQNKPTQKILNELNWGIRVFKRNLDSWNLLTSSYMEETGNNIDRLNLNTSVLLANYFDQAISVLTENNQSLSIAATKAEINKTDQNLKETQEFVVKVMTRLNVRKSPEILLNNIVGQLQNGDRVRSRSNKIVNNFVEVEVVKSNSLKTDFKPIFVNLKYLYPVESTQTLPLATIPKFEDRTIPVIDSEVQSDILNQLSDVKTVFDDFTEVSKINGDIKAQENLENIKAIFNFDPTLNTGDKTVATEATTSVVPSKTLDETNSMMTKIIEEAQATSEEVEEVKPTPVDNSDEVETKIVKKTVVIENKKTIQEKSKKQVPVVVKEKNKPATKVEVTDIKEEPSSKIEIVYDEPTPSKVVEVKSQKQTSTKKLKKDKSSKLPPKVTPTVQVETINSEPTKKVEVVQPLTTDELVIDTKGQEQSIEVNGKSSVIEIKSEVKTTQTTEENLIVTQPEASSPIVVTPSESKVVETKSEVKIDSKVEATRKELDAIEKMIEMRKSGQKATEVQVVEKTTTTETVTTDPVVVTPTPVDNKPYKKSLEEKSKVENIFDQVISQKNEEYRKAQEIKKQQPAQQTPEQEDPLKMKTEGQTTYETGPSFDDE